MLVAALALAAPAAAQDEPPIFTESVETLIAAGDIASCSSWGDEATASLLDELPGTIATLGDNVYDSGTPWEFIECYGPSWGRHWWRTRPAPGNHEYYTPGAFGYFDYFGWLAGDWGVGYYSYDLGDWHIVALNSNCDEVGGCHAGSPQEQWLRNDLAASTKYCTLAYWHHPRFSSGNYGNDPSTHDFWQALYDYGAEVVLTGHEHNYERFARQDPWGNWDPDWGIRQFVVGTGGKSHYPIWWPQPNSVAHNDNTFGVLVLTLYPGYYHWQFVPEPGRSYSDSGWGTCH